MSENSYQSPYILIADDDEDDRFIIQQAFNDLKSNFTLHFVENGLELVNYFDKLATGNNTIFPSLVIVDINMPIKSGREALEELASKSYFGKIRKVILSTASNEAEMKKCESLGSLGYFVKPSRFNELVDLAARFIELSRVPQER